MHLTFSSDIECSISERTISGKIVPFDGEIGQTSAGKVIFEKGSIEIPDNPKPKLLLEHDAKKPLGRMLSYEEREDGIYATFRVAYRSLRDAVMKVRCDDLFQAKEAV